MRKKQPVSVQVELPRCCFEFAVPATYDTCPSWSGGCGKSGQHMSCLWTSRRQAAGSDSLVLATGKTTTTRVLPVLANATMTGRDVATAVEREESQHWFVSRFPNPVDPPRCCYFQCTSSCPSCRSTKPQLFTPVVLITINRLGSNRIPPLSSSASEGFQLMSDVGNVLFPCLGKSGRHLVVGSEDALGCGVVLATGLRVSTWRPNFERWFVFCVGLASSALQMGWPKRAEG